MALQLTGAFKKDALANLQVRLPAVVIGGGLTGVDTATELLAYYPIQVEKIARPLRGAGARAWAKRACAGMLDAEEQRHPRRVPASTAARCAPSARAPRPRARRRTSSPLVRGWGGVTLAYRKRLQDSPPTG